MSYNEKLKEIMDGMPDEPDIPKPLNTNIKTHELCDTCRFDISRACEPFGCLECERYNPDPGRISQHSCECLAVKYGEPCPYYEKATEE